MDSVDDIIIPSMESAQYSTRDLKSVTFTHLSPKLWFWKHKNNFEQNKILRTNFLNHSKGPVEHTMKIPQILEVRLKHGIFFTVDVDQKQVSFAGDGLT